MELDTLPILTRPYGPAAQDAPDDAPSLAALPDLYSLIPYTDDFQARAESRRCFNPVESASRVAWIDVDGDQGAYTSHRVRASIADAQYSDCENFELAGRTPRMQKPSHPPRKWVENFVSRGYTK